MIASAESNREYQTRHSQKLRRHLALLHDVLRADPELPHNTAAIRTFSIPFLVEPIFPSAYCFVFSSIYVKDTTTDDGEGVE